MEGANNKKQTGAGDKEILFSKAIKAGSRIYYLDVKKNLKEDMFLAITESKKNYPKDGSPITYEKHKIFIYQEDFTKFLDGMNEVINYIRIHSDAEERAVEPNDEGPSKEEPSDEIKLNFNF